MKIDRFVWTDNVKPRTIISANDKINNHLLYIETMGCGIRNAGKKVCEDFGCESIIEIIELMSDSRSE